MNMVIVWWRASTHLAAAGAIIGCYFFNTAEAQTFSVSLPVRVSRPAQIVAEFSSATAPNNPQLMAASAIKRVSPSQTVLAVYVSRDGGQHWSEVPAWPDTGLQAIYDPWVAIGIDGTIHATGIARSNKGSRVAYTQSRDQGATWSPARAVTPLVSKFHRRSADKDCLTVADDGTIYVAFNQVLTSPLGERGLIVARSTDNGLSWTPRDTRAAGFPNGIVTAAGGTVTVTFVGGSVPGYGTVTSTDGGDNWAAPVNLGALNLSDGLPLPSIVREASGRIVIGDIGGATAPQLEVSFEDLSGTVVAQSQLPTPNSNTCQQGRLIQPAVTRGPNRSAAFQVACKVDPTASTAGRQEIWLYPNVHDPSIDPVLVRGFQLPPLAASHDRFAARFPDGGDYWSFTWKAQGWLGMWVDPRTGGGPGELRAAAVTEQ